MSMYKGGRASQGARGLKQFWSSLNIAANGRASQGARGLKRTLKQPGTGTKASRLARGAWIETKVIWTSSEKIKVAPRKGRVD